MNVGILRLYCGKSGEIGFYNMQEIGLAKAMQKFGWKTVVFYLDTKIKEIEEQEIEGVRLARIPARKIKNHGFFSLVLLKEYRLDILQIQSDNQFFLPSVCRWCRKNRLRYYCMVGTLYSDTNHKWKKKFMNLISWWDIRQYQKSMVFVKTPEIQKELKKKGAPNAVLCPVGLDTEHIPEIRGERQEIRNELKIPSYDKILLFVGRLEPYKCPELLVDLMKKLEDNCVLIIIGDGSLKEELLNRFRAAKLINRIKYFPKIDNHEIHKFYYVCDYYINLNPKEIFGMGILEAMYQNAKVIAMKAPGPNYILEREDGGFLTETLEDMAKIILKKTNVKDNRPRQRILDIFTWKKSAEIIRKELEKRKWIH